MRVRMHAFMSAGGCAHTPSFTSKNVNKKTAGSKFQTEVAYILSFLHQLTVSQLSSIAVDD